MRNSNGRIAEAKARVQAELVMARSEYLAVENRILKGPVERAAAAFRRQASHAWARSVIA
jgi:hypothetical protein